MEQKVHQSAQTGAEIYSREWPACRLTGQVLIVTSFMYVFIQ